jgi:hypothetical protein
MSMMCLGMFLNIDKMLMPSASDEISRVPIKVTARDTLSTLEGSP